MPKKKRPRDPNQLAAEIVGEAVGDKPKQQEPELDPVEAYKKEFARKGGLAGGPARASALSAKKRKEIARKAAKARWKKPK
jgi:hypothetical protein